MCRTRLPASSDCDLGPRPACGSGPCPTPAYITNVNMASPFCFLNKKENPIAIFPPCPLLPKPPPLGSLRAAVHLGPVGTELEGWVFPGSLGGAPRGPGSPCPTRMLTEAALSPTDPAGDGFLSGETSGSLPRGRSEGLSYYWPEPA